jgi:hypothetical protein
MSVGYPSDGERFRESIGVELRIRPRAGDRTDVDEQIHSHLLEQSQKLTPAFVSFWSLLSLSLMEAVLTSPCGDKAFVKRFGDLSDREFAQIFSQGIEAANCTLEEKAQGVRRSFLIRAHDEGKDRGKRASIDVMSSPSFLNLVVIARTSVVPTVRRDCNRSSRS